MENLSGMKPVEELFQSLTKRIREMGAEAHDDVEERREKFRQYERDRYRRYELEVHDLVRQREALLFALAKIEATKPIVLLTASRS